MLAHLGAAAQEWWLYLLGYMIQGESALLAWFLVPADHAPTGHLLFLGLAFLLTIFSYQGYFLLGRLGWLGARKLTHSLSWSRFDQFVGERCPGIVLLGLRFFYGVRHPLTIALGAAGLPFGKFLFYNILGGMLWLAWWVVLGIVLAHGLQSFFLHHWMQLRWLYTLLLGAILLHRWLIKPWLRKGTLTRPSR